MGAFRRASSIVTRTCVVATAAAAVVASACTLPVEQLSLPKPIGPAPFDPGRVPGQGGSTPLGDAGHPAAREPRSYEGSAQFTTSVQKAADDAPGKVFGASTGEGVSLDLVNASIPEAARAVLSDALGVTYVVSDRVKGSITLKTAGPVDKAGLLEVFESILETQNAAIVVSGNVYKVVTREEAIASGKPVGMRADSRPRPPGISSEIVPLRYVAAAEMERILRSMAPQATIARVDSSRNMLVLSGSAAELQSMVDTITTFDVDWMRGMSFGIYPVDTSDTEAIAQELDTIFANDRDSPTKGIVRFVPNARLRSIVVISSRPEYLRKAEGWIKQIDMAGQATEKRAFVYHVQYRPVTELAQVLNKIYNPRDQRSLAIRESIAGTPGAAGISGAPADALAMPTGSAGGTALVGNTTLTGTPGQPLEPFDATKPATAAAVPAAAQPAAQGADIVPAGDLAAQSGATTRSGMLATAPPDDRSAGISIVADEANNSLVITASSREIRRIRQVLAEIDVVPAQILLEATIAEVTLNDDLKFGLRWFFEHKSNEFRLTDSALGAIAPAFPGFSYFLNLPNAQVALNALATITNVDVVSSPSLMVLNNKKAVLQIGDEVPVATQSAVSVLTPDAPVVNSISFRNTGILLNIIPRVSEEGKILLEIEQEVSDVKATTSSTLNSPTIAQRRIKTTVVVANGGSIVLAGLMQDRATRDRQQVPLVGDVPFLGNLFKNKNDTIARTELLIAISPHVVTDNAQVRMIAAEFRDRLNLSTRPQRATPPDRREQLDRVIR